MRFGIFTSQVQQGSNLKKVPNQPICKGDNFLAIIAKTSMHVVQLLLMLIH